MVVRDPQKPGFKGSFAFEPGEAFKRFDKNVLGRVVRLTLIPEKNETG